MAENKIKSYSPSEVLKILGNGLYEIRILSRYTQSMYTMDLDSVNKKIENANDGKSNVYFTLNNLNTALYSRPQRETLISDKKLSTTSDNDIISYRWLLIDFDPVRPSDVASSEPEKYKALLKARSVFKMLTERGIPTDSLVVADSGNGYHILVRVDIPNNKQNVDMVKNFLLTLDFLFSDKEIQVDTKNFNPARITKMYGTYSRKGMNTSERPHRLSNLIVVPEKIEVCNTEFIESIAKIAQDRLAESKVKQYFPNSSNFNANQYLDEFIEKYSINAISDITKNGVRRIKLDCCPFNSSHQHDSMIGVADNKPFFYCFHNSCSNNHWREFRLLYEPNFEKEREQRKAEYEAKKQGAIQSSMQYQPKPQKVNVIDIVTSISQKSDKSNQNKKTANPLDETKEWFSLQDGLEALNFVGDEPQGFSTGFANLDKELEDGILAKGQFTIISGDNSSGKSTFINQLVLNLADKGYKSLVYSGELAIQRFTKWILRQACGSENMAISRKGNKYVPNNVANRIVEWSNEKIFLYNNKHSQKVSEIMKSIIKCIEEKGIEFIVIDNLMSMETDELGKDYGVDKQIIQASIKVAQDYNVHIVLIAHPRKANGYLRKDDICGEKNIANLADNIFIMHRNNADFIRSYYEFKTGKKWNEGCKQEFEGYGNILEICKNRENGSAIDKKIPFYFDVNSKRFMQTEQENITYGWQKGFISNSEIEEIEDLPY